ncbi:MAG: glycoside hydrolase family 3 C-terminal domain-containing protein, partial [Pseudobutyrivibrio sp.]|nr:glycoside hydrolase family 3 C-terminal domain-containing protein [Pseudobutyrivibrio sp.]
NNTFPLDKPCKLAAYGNGVRHSVKGGTGSGEVNSRFAVGVEQGLEEAGFTLTSKSWLDDFDKILEANHQVFVEGIKAKSKELHVPAIVFAMGLVEPEPEHDLKIDATGDAAIYVLARNSGEGNDRKVEKGDVLLTDAEVRDILLLNKQFDKFMLVLNVGGPVDLTPVLEVENILLLSQLGVVTGNVLADILLGKMNPSGKLATTWTKATEYCKIGDFGGHDDVNYNEGIYVGYRYFDTADIEPMFPFGYGKSYTDFDITAVKVTNNSDAITVETTVKNTGAMSGKEVVQVYVSAPAGKLDKPAKDLAGFGKTSEIAAGEEASVSVTFSLRDMASYDESTASYILEKGDYIIYVGNSSRNVRATAVVSLDGDVTTLQTRNCLGTPGFKDYAPNNARKPRAVQSGLQVINLAASDIATVTVAHDVDYTVDPVISQLSDEELVYMNIGAFDPDSGEGSVIGNASFSVAGAAGETTTKCNRKGIKSMVMADGPAGLRLNKEYYEDETGVHGLSAGMPKSMLDLLDDEERQAMDALTPKLPEGAQVKEQYATAIPIGTAIAQSFNCDLAKSYGDIVGDEMERFKVQLWLAPALNIHRSILCGRNFEYYSEDPVVAGLMAAAITEGVQQHKGCGTTIKHYAANNAETNRYNSNSNVSERAMREIYLKGFGICVKLSQPKAVMTSYNLLNGTHTSEHRGLIEDILRDEYGFKGIVMTDWVIDMLSSGAENKHRGARADEVVKAGGDLFMPGCQSDYDKIMAGLRSGAISRKQLQINATRVYHMAEALN